MSENLGNIPEGFFEKKLLDMIDTELAFDIFEGKLLGVEASIEYLLDRAKSFGCYTFTNHRDSDRFGMSLIRNGVDAPIVLVTRQEPNNEKSVWISENDQDRINKLFHQEDAEGAVR